MEGLLTELNLEKTRIPNFIYKGSIFGKSIVLVRTGAGTRNAKWATKITLYLCRPSIVLSIGWAGGTREEVKYGDIVVGDTIYSHDCQPVSSDPKLCSLAAQVLKESKMRFHVGGSLTVPRPLRSPQEKKEAGNKWPVSMVEMESYQVTLAAVRKMTPCLTVRIISDTVNQTVKSKLHPSQSVNDALKRFLVSFLKAV